MYDVASAAVEAALNAGARYADARVMESRSEVVGARNGHVELVDRGERAGIGVRALIGSSWGFFAVPDATPAAARAAGERAAEIARASTLVPGRPLELAPVAPQRGSWANRVDEDPWQVPLGEKATLL
jgi:TldD protein